ncbi:glycosyltransferase family 4 protein [Pseudoalteromonas umbrosa]|uniref:glycosyltransferase family 4 protein n=1 Tax=Pseudoalteromonas umbrosa TaxID=3048489 RepID=UPI0024C2D604|nr:glycosyltransferase family 4 protein [Pseudoalteromonas sp. B95]MDK1289559.1 glycosyltransferase family 4 protein [Pseudoalteromonas sp. B95]
MRKVFLVANSPFTILNFRKELIKEFKRKGFAVYVLFPDSTDLMSAHACQDAIRELGCECIHIPLSRNGMNPKDDLALVMFLRKIFKREKPDLVMNYTIKATIYSSIAARLSGVRNIYSNITGLGYVFIGMDLKTKALRFFIKNLYKFSLSFNKKVFFQNPDDRELFNKFGMCKLDKSVLINGSGVDTAHLNRSSTNRNNKKFLFVGRILKDKGVVEYINAARMLKKEYPDTEFALAGAFDSNPSAISKQQISEYEQEGVIKYLGVTSDIKGLLNEYGVFVLPSYREGTPRSTLEAISMSMPVVTTNVPGCKETVIEGYNGFLVDPKSANDLARGLSRILEHDDFDLLANNSRKLAVDKFDVHNVNGNILDVVL